MASKRKIQVGDTLYGLYESCGTYCECDAVGDWVVEVVGKDYVLARCGGAMGVWDESDLHNTTIHEYLVPYLTKKEPPTLEQHQVWVDGMGPMDRLVYDTLGALNKSKYAVDPVFEKLFQL